MNKIKLTRWYSSSMLFTLFLPLTSASSASHWHRFRSIGLGPRQEQAVTALNKDIYILGGVNYNFNSILQTVNMVEVYDTLSNSWSVAAPLPLPVNHANAVGVDERVYVFGSLTPSGTDWNAISDSWFYDPWNDTWTGLPAMPKGTARGAAAVGVYGKTVYLAGGTTYQQPYAGGTQDAVATVSSYDTNTGIWDTEFPPLPEPRQHVGGAVVNGTFYVLVGRTDGAEKVKDDVFALNLEDVQAGWKKKSPMPTAREGLGCAPLGEKIYCMGGENPELEGHGVYKETEVYDVWSDSWGKLEDMAVPRHGTNAVSVDEKIHVPGGGTVTGGGPVGIVDAFVP
ncbi:hypothetical protein BJ170DRAFT_679855 [Xylariales sp. AK1849]|nr:hypothetical protein BJ170DRAFT_679855 [Xylariales sp. AK1849]